ALTLAELAKAEVLQQVSPKLSLLRLLATMAGEPTVALRGFSKFTWFRTLKNSARKSMLSRSVSLIFFCTPESRFQKLGPCARLRPLPFCPGNGTQKKVCVPTTFRQLKWGSAGLVMRGPMLYITGPSTPFIN